MYPAGSSPPAAATRSVSDADVAIASCDVAASVDGGVPEVGARYMWVLQMRPDHCWIVADIVPAAVH